MNRNRWNGSKRWLFTSLLTFFTLSLAADSDAGQKNDLLLFMPAILSGKAGPPGFGNPPQGNGKYTLLAWNDLGMHCMDPNFEDFAVLPPYNTLWAQLIRRGEEPDIVTQNVTLSYRVLGNTRSATKTNFWDYAHKLFGLSAPLPKISGSKDLASRAEWQPSVPLSLIALPYYRRKKQSPREVIEFGSTVDIRGHCHDPVLTIIITAPTEELPS